MLYISIIISAFNSIFGLFFDVLFEILLAPLPDSHINKAAVAVAPVVEEKPKVKRQMGTILKTNAKKLMLVNKLGKVNEVLTHSLTYSRMYSLTYLLIRITRMTRKLRNCLKVWRLQLTLLK